MKWRIVLLGIVVMTQGMGATYLDKQVFMSLKQAETRYGATAFAAAKFKNASAAERAKMAVSLVKSKQYIGADPKQVIAELGESTGYFWSRQIPAYLIDEGSDKHRDIWQLVFLIGDDGTVTNVKIHKNCCSEKPERATGSTVTPKD